MRNYNLSPALNSITAAINKLNLHTTTYLNNMFNTLNQAAKIQTRLATNTVIDNLKNVFSKISAQIIEAQNNPNSIFSWMNYEKELENMHWAWPYNISSDDLYEVLNNSSNEKDFDKIIAKHFTDKLIKEIYEQLSLNVAKHHRVMLKQAYSAFLRKEYAIANNALLSILDNSLSLYLANKGQTRRKGILRPILEHYDNESLSDIASFIFELGMLSNNIDFIFTDINFAKKEKISTNKVARRHSALHGVKYSNKKIDTLMLFNTLINLFQLQPILKDFENSIIYDKKTFCFNDKFMYSIRKKSTENLITSMTKLPNGATHKDLLNCLSNAHFMHSYPKSINKYLSYTLQYMKKKNIIMNEKRNGVTFWIFKNN